MVPTEGKKVKYSKAVLAYGASHQRCEACGRPASEVHHVRTKGAGGDDDPANLLSLCREHHAEVHTMGKTALIEHFPYLYDKITGAMARRRRKKCAD